MAITNPFQPAELTTSKLKLLLFGTWGTGKTFAALTFPRVAVIDSEGSTTLYRGRPGIAPFSVLDTKSMTDLENAIAFIAADAGKTFDTLVIDPVSVVYKVTREALAAANKKNPGDMGFREWGKLNARMNSLYTRLVNLPVHVVMIARESIEYEGAGDSMKKVGVKPDSDKDIGYLFDVVVHMQDDYSGLVTKSRAAQIKKGQRIPTVNWSVFAPLAEGYATGKAMTHAVDDTVIADEAGREQARDEFQDRELVEAFVAEWKHKGASVKDILKALNVQKMGQWTKGKDEAAKVMRAFMGFDKPTPPKWWASVTRRYANGHDEASQKAFADKAEALLADGTLAHDAGPEAAFDTITKALEDAANEGVIVDGDGLPATWGAVVRAVARHMDGDIEAAKQFIREGLDRFAVDPSDSADKAKLKLTAILAREAIENGTLEPIEALLAPEDALPVAAIAGVDGGTDEDPFLDLH